MTLQQLRYLLAIARCGSISSAAHELYVSQSSLSTTVKDIENECGITVFERSPRGITVTREGSELLGYARQILEQADLFEARYSKISKPIAQRLSIASQHYTFPVEAFLDFIEDYEGENYTFCLSETHTEEVIHNVAEFRCDIGIIYLSTSNEQVLRKALKEANLSFHALFQATPHVFVGKKHPLAKRKILHLDDLKPYPRYSFEQGSNNSCFYAEEPLAEIPHEKQIIISDRGTLSNLLAHHTGYTITTGVLSSEMHSKIVSIPLETSEKMVVGYIVHNERQLSALAQRYIETLKLFIEDYNKGYAAL